MAGLDERCAKPIVARITEREGKHRFTSLVCDDCAVALYLEDDLYDVVRIDGRPVLAS